MATHPQPGRLGNPDETLGTDPRTDPRLAAAIAPLGLPISATDPTEAQVEFPDMAEEGFQASFGAVSGGLEQAMRDVYQASARDVIGFASSL